mgnify:CR=1 FL=1
MGNVFYLLGIYFVMEIIKGSYLRLIKTGKLLDILSDKSNIWENSDSENKINSTSLVLAIVMFISSPFHSSDNKLDLLLP